MKIISYNVNGIRAAINKGLIEWLKDENPDIVCIQELKAMQDQVDITPFTELGYEIYWHSAVKKGYSGVAIFSKIPARHVEYGCGIEKYDFEGRVIRADFEDFSILSVYHPSGSSGDERQDFKMEWLKDFYTYIENLKKSLPNLILSGDLNICHKEIDIHNPKSNAKSSGFLPEERAWVDHFLELGFVDSYRIFHPEPGSYTWWSYRFNSRAKNLGWRIDYHFVTNSIKERIKVADILNSAEHSDHCPVSIIFE
ncbi:MAG: Exodeoxyribonuclease [Bacteroidota bacterium]|jgi:exodeoxyribonuclease-3